VKILRDFAIDVSAMDVGVTTSFEFSGVPPFKVEYTEQKDKQRPKTKIERFDNHVGKIDLTPEQEGEYTYVRNRELTLLLADLADLRFPRRRKV
jgi:hypothetical protein